MKLKINKPILNELLEAHTKLSNLLDTSKNSTCSIGKEHKKAIRIYMESWIMPSLVSSINAIRGDKGAQINCIQMGEFHKNSLDKKLKKYEY